jgi:hypothetical protein
MKTALVYIRGLNTKAESDWCGIRAFLETLAPQLEADLISLDYDDDAGIVALEARLAGYDIIHAAGHSHGAAALYGWLQRTSHQVCVAVFLDLCPAWNPTAWLNVPWPAPPHAKKVLVFYQRNDVPLAGVRLAGPRIQEFNVTGWGLHHSTMCGDARVQDHIALVLLWPRAEAVSDVAISVVSGG